MTRAMRWRVGAFTIVGTLTLGASFVGCGGDDDDGGPPPGEDSGVDTAVGADTKDGATTETTPDTADGGGGGDTADTPDVTPPTPDRQVTIVFGQPDSAPLFVCLGAFAGDPTTAAKPVQAIGPAGIPDSAAPTDPTKYKGFGFGGVLPFPVATPEAKAALTSLTVVAYFVESNPLTATPAKKCEDVWADVKTDTNRWFKVAPNTIKAGESHVLALAGCKNPSTSPVPQACGTGTTDNREFVFAKLDTTAPAAGAFNTQFLHLSAFPGITGAAPSFQGIDVYIQPMKPGTAADAGGDTLLPDVASEVATDATAPSPEPAGTPIKIGTNLKFKDLVSPPAAVTLPAGTDPKLSFYVLAATGTTPCLGGPSTSCPTAYTLPAGTYLDLYKGAGADWKAGTEQLLFLLGSAVPVGTPPKPVIIVGESNYKAGW
jgi:hypothetical protein